MSLPSADGASPALAQWFEAKRAHPDALVFFRLGDFYEMFFADAEAAAPALGLQLTARGEHAGAPVPMCGVPAHAAESYLARLIRRGWRVAVVEQTEEPKTKQGKTPLRREVVRVVTPGTLTEDALLDAGRSNLLLAVARVGDWLGAAWLDVSSGLFEVEEVRPATLPGLLARLDPAEIIAAPAVPLGDWEDRRGPDQPVSPPLAARHRVAEAFEVADAAAFGLTDAESVAACVALAYARQAAAGRLPRLSHPQRGGGGALQMDAATRASLEILRARDGGPHSLLATVDKTLTAPGARLLAGWLGAPLLDPAGIAARQEAWSWLLPEPGALAGLRAALKGAPDMARALGRISLGRGAPRDLAGLRDGLAAAGRAAAAIEGAPGLLGAARAALGDEAGLGPLLDRALAGPLPARLDDGGIIAPGFDGELDAERALRDGGRQALPALALDLAQKLGVASLKIKHHAQLGYVLEAPAAAVERLRVQPGIVLRQATANGGRFSTPELADLDQRIGEAGERAEARERLVWETLCAEALRAGDALAACADALARLDALQSCAWLAEDGRWCAARVGEGTGYRVVAGRHPVVEAALPGAAAFVANGCDLSPGRRVLLLTGPNMAGKSTFLRQNALIVVLAQTGLPVPAESAELGVVDRLFSRVGAADDLARGQSTFMAEMLETAAILNQAGPRSFVVVDEIGRGTGTRDGLAIAWAVLEALHDGVRCRALFATHFHELAGLAGRLPQMCPHTMRVREWKGGVVFLHEVGEGAAGRSWGVHVAKLAGVPLPVVRRAESLLAALDRGGLGDLPLFAAAPISSDPPVAPDLVQETLAALDPDRMSPREALDALYRLRALASEPTS